MFKYGSSPQDISKITGRYTDDIKNASMVINTVTTFGKVNLL